MVWAVRLTDMSASRVLPLLFVSVLLVGCASEGQVGSADTPPPLVETSATDEHIPSIDVGAGSEARHIVTNATLELEVVDVGLATRTARSIADEHGATVALEDRSDANAHLRLRVPPESLRLLLDELESIGEVQHHSLSAEDVSDRVVDLDSRIDSATVSVDRLRGLLDESGSVPDIAAVEEQLLLRETTLEQLRGQRRLLSDRSALATVDVTFVERAELDAGGLPGLDEAFSAGVAGLVRLGHVLAIGVVGTAPFVPVVLLGWLTARVVSRRRAAEHHAAK